MSPEIIGFISALLVALFSAFLSVLTYLRQAKIENAFNIDLAHADRIISAEELISPEVLSLYGIYLTEADKADTRVTPERIRYVVAIVNAQYLRFGRNRMGKEIDPAALAEMFNERDGEDYMPRFFAQSLSREVWREARRCFRKVLRDNVDTYLTNKYEKEYQERPLPPL